MCVLCFESASRASPLAHDHAPSSAHARFRSFPLEKNADDAASSGGVDLRGEGSTIELLKNGLELRVTGLSADEAHPGAQRETRVVTLRASKDAGQPALERWFSVLKQSQGGMRLHARERGISLKPEAQVDVPVLRARAKTGGGMGRRLSTFKLPAGASVLSTNRTFVSFDVTDPGMLGLVLGAAYNVEEKRVVIEVHSVREGGMMERLGSKQGDWLERLGDIDVDVWRNLKADGDGMVTESEIAILLEQVRKLCPPLERRDHSFKSAHEMMQAYDLDGNHELDPHELVELMNDELLDAIVRLVVQTPRPVTVTFARLKHPVGWTDDVALVAPPAPMVGAPVPGPPPPPTFGKGRCKGSVLGFDTNAPPPAEELGPPPIPLGRSAAERAATAAENAPPPAEELGPPPAEELGPPPIPLGRSAAERAATAAEAEAARAAAEKAVAEALQRAEDARLEAEQLEVARKAEEARLEEERKESEFRAMELASSLVKDGNDHFMGLLLQTALRLDASK